MKCCEEKEPLGRLIYCTGQDMQNFGKKALKPYELTLEQLHLLKNLSTDTGMSQRELGGRVRKTPANMTRILDRLELKSLAIRREDPNDRRASLVFLTEKGKALQGEVINEFQSFDPQLFKGITEETKQTLRNAFEQIKTNIEQMLQDLDKKGGVI